MEIIESGSPALIGRSPSCGAHGIYSIIDLHAVPGAQNQHWHSDNATHVAMFWQQRQFQDRAVNLWQAIATRYRDEPAVAGYNLLNEPADESAGCGRTVLPPAHRAIREIDPAHIHFLDGNTYATEFGFFGAAGAAAPSTHCTTTFRPDWAVAAATQEASTASSTTATSC